STEAFLGQDSHDLVGIIGKYFRDGAYHYLLGGQPWWQGTRILFNQHANEALKGAQNGPVHHDRRTTLVGSIDLFSPQTYRHGKVHLNGTTLPVTANGIFQGIFNFRAIKSAFSGRNFKFATRTTQAFHESFFSLVPDGIIPNTLFRAGSHFIQDIGKAKVTINFLQQGRKVGAFILQLVFSTENVTIVLGKA